MYYHKTVNAETGEETIIEFTKDETTAMEANIAKAKAEDEALQIKQQARLAVLDRLGLTADEAALLLS